MSVLDNVKVGAHARGRNGPLTDALTLPSTRREEQELDATARAMLAFVGLEATCRAAGREPHARCDASASSLRARSPAQPTLLLLDEPAGGFNHEEVGGTRRPDPRHPRPARVTVLLVEHHMGLVMSLSDQVVVLNFGRVIANGTPDEVRNNPAVTEAYLGTRH